ncbi:elongation factor P 5-aminopentanone reductase [Jeotgalibacillus salarius]|uniref:SDR family oxidoreductase n=1 Tax=Jeotgalibacillus salarius TaxID=546023 RepID=A0A4Y8LMZ7_9BACL|nr:SDR family oxidoreductase [Jeotgalibacillus salarius]TFE02821.1 SDR family oxidoreductase [Jeotgalibacillus salarius]
MDKTVLVLGSSGGIGYEVCSKLLQSGHTVIAQFHTNEEIVNSLKRYARQSDQIIPLRVNLNDEKDVDRAISNLIQPDAVVQAGGHHDEGLFEEISDEKMEKLWNVHFYQPARILRSVIPGMRQREGASIVFVSSVWGETGASYEVMYSAVKGAQISFVKALGKELAPNRIRVNAVSPGAVETQMTAHYSPEVKRAIEDEIPAGRFGHPYEIADAVIFLLSEQSSYINGHVLSVNGGWYN